VLGPVAHAAQAQGLIDDVVVLRLSQRHYPGKSILIVFRVDTPRLVELDRLHGLLPAEPAKTDSPPVKVACRRRELHLEVSFHEAPIP